MISQKCPKCLSRNVRRGYQRTPILMRLFFRYYLLCDNCNWEFTGFAVPGTVSTKPRRSKKKAKTSNELNNPMENKVELESQGKIKKKVKVKYQ